MNIKRSSPLLAMALTLLFCAPMSYAPLSAYPSTAVGAITEDLNEEGGLDNTIETSNSRDCIPTIQDTSGREPSLLSQSQQASNVPPELFMPLSLGNPPTAGLFDYSMTEVGYGWTDASSGTLHDLSTSNYEAVVLPFDFNFYGESFSTLYISAYGWMSFYNDAPDSGNVVWFPTSDESFWYSVSLYGANLIPGPTVYTESFTSPNRFVVQYQDVDYVYYEPAPAGTFQVVFYETGEIEFNYQDVYNTNGFEYRVGLNHGPIDDYEMYSFALFPVSSQSLLFEPPSKWLLITSPATYNKSDYTLEWAGGSDETISMYYVDLDAAFYDNTTTNSMSLPGLSDGVHAIDLKMETGGSNYTTTMSLLIDTNDPTISIIYPDDLSTLTDAKVNWTASDSTSSIDRFEILVDHVFYQSYESSTQEAYLVLSNQAWHNITVVAYDQAENWASDYRNVYYDRAMPAVGFVTTHNEMPQIELINQFENSGYLVHWITGDLASASLGNYDVIFIGPHGNTWPSEDTVALDAYMDGGGRVVILAQGEFPEGLESLIEKCGIVNRPEFTGASPEGLVSDYAVDHPFMSGVTELFAYSTIDRFTLSFPAEEIIHDPSGNYTLGALSEKGNRRLFCVDMAISPNQYDNLQMYQNIVTDWPVNLDHELKTLLYSPDAAGTGQTIEVQAYVLNQGSNTETGFDLEVWVDGVLDTVVPVTDLGFGSNENTTLQVPVGVGPTLNITAYVAPQAGETLTYNNRRVRILTTYTLKILTPLSNESVKGGTLYVTYNATYSALLDNVSVYVNSQYILFINPSSQPVPGSELIVPIFANGTNNVTLVGHWSGASASDSVLIQSYAVVPIIRPAPGDYIDYVVTTPSINSLTKFNATFGAWLSAYEINVTMEQYTYQAGVLIASQQTWLSLNILNGYIGTGSTGPFSWVGMRFFPITGLICPEPVPYATTLDSNSNERPSVEDRFAYIMWNIVFEVTDYGTWEGYAVANAAYGSVMTGKVLQCNGLLVSLHATGLYAQDYYIARSSLLPSGDRPPVVSSPEDFEFLDTETGNQITWVVSGNLPSLYRIYKNGTVVDDGTWIVGDRITTGVDTQVGGVWNWTLAVYDDNDAWTSDTVWVSVTDTIDPTITNMGDVTYPEGELGAVAVWNASDYRPYRYTIYKDGVELESGAWDGSSIVLSVEALVQGTYNYTCVVYDAFANHASSTVMVTVTEPPLNMVLIVAIIGVGAAAVVVVVFIMMRRKKP